VVSGPLTPDGTGSSLFGNQNYTWVDVKKKLDLALHAMYSITETVYIKRKLGSGWKSRSCCDDLARIDVPSHFIS
jgi:hypothetical protein